VQGTAADIIKLAMIRVYRELEAKAPAVKLVLQVHDELVLEVPENEIKSVARTVQEAMISVADLSAPIEVHLKAGVSWGKLTRLAL